MRDREDGDVETIRAAYLLIGSRKEMETVRRMGMYVQLGTVLESLDRRNTDQVSERMAARGSRESAAEARELFMERHMKPIAAIAGLLALKYPEMNAIRMPKERLKTSDLIAHAIAMAEQAMKRKDEFVDLGLRPDFFERLHEGAQELREASDQPRQHRAASHGATSGAEADLKLARQTLAAVDALVKREVDDPAVLAEWAMVKKYPPRKKAAAELPQLEAAPEVLQIEAPAEVHQLASPAAPLMLPAPLRPIQATARIAEEKAAEILEPRRWFFWNLLRRLRSPQGTQSGN